MQFLKLPTEILQRRDLTSADKLVFAVVLDRIGQNDHCWLGLRVIAKDSGMSKSTAHESIIRLKACGLLAVEKRGTGKVNHYRITDQKRTKIRTYSEQTNNQSKSASKKSSSKSKRFVKPTAEQVTEYAKSIGFDLDGGEFVDHYQAGGWTIGKNKPMRCWKAAVRTWKRYKAKWDQEKQAAKPADNDMEFFNRKGL